MFYNQKLLPLMAAAVLLFAACGSRAEPVDAGTQEVSVRETVTEADPKTAVDEIYKTLPEAKTIKLTGYEISTCFPDLDAKSLTSYFGCVSNPDDGLAELIILQPAEGKREAVRDALRQYQERRIREFENYDILSAFEIAKNALVIDQGDYVILLMLPDNEAARDIIDLYIPL